MATFLIITIVTMSRLFILLILCISLSDCTNESKGKTLDESKVDINELKIPLDSVDIGQVYYNKNTSEWKFGEKAFSGFVTSRYPDESLKSVFGVLEGKKQNSAADYYPDGSLKFSTDYYNGRIHGEKKSWSNNTPRMLISSLNYFQGKPHGEQKQWYPTGEIFKIMNLDMGKESGMQQAFRKNGDLFANYEARNGRIFGLKKTALCFGLDDENIID